MTSIENGRDVGSTGRHPIGLINPVARAVPFLPLRPNPLHNQTIEPIITFINYS